VSQLKCSRAGCQALATALLNWRNPKIHAVDRVKTWASCAAHQEFLTEYLNARDFLLSVHGVDEVK
jgi:hypothetical protein